MYPKQPGAFFSLLKHLFWKKALNNHPCSSVVACNSCRVGPQYHFSVQLTYNFIDTFYKTLHLNCRRVFFYPLNKLPWKITILSGKDIIKTVDFVQPAMLVFWKVASFLRKITVSSIPSHTPPNLPHPSEHPYLEDHPT